MKRSVPGAFSAPVPNAPDKPKLRCAIYTRKSNEEGLDQEYNSLDAQRDAALAFIMSQKHEGRCVHDDRYDAGGYSGGTMERPGLQRSLADIVDRRIDVMVVVALIAIWH